jgi:hypothetical protein
MAGMTTVEPGPDRFYPPAALPRHDPAYDRNILWRGNLMQSITPAGQVCKQYESTGVVRTVVDGMGRTVTAPSRAASRWSAPTDPIHRERRPGGRVASGSFFNQKMLTLRRTVKIWPTGSVVGWDWRRTCRRAKP